MYRTYRGFTLLEVMIALLVFSLGLIGLAGLLTVSVRTNQSAYLRTQATFLAQSIADRMSANSLGLWNSKYNLNTIAAPAAAATAAPTGCDTASCDYAGIATRDLATWQYQVASFLPNPLVAIACTAPTTTPSAAQLLLLPPYSTTCEIEMQWSSLPIDGQKGTTAVETFDWVFQP